MSRRTGLILFLALAALFLILNRPAYKGYFTDDDFDNLSWTHQSSLGTFVKGLVTPQYQTNNFRVIEEMADGAEVVRFRL